MISYTCYLHIITMKYKQFRFSAVMLLVGKYWIAYPLMQNNARREGEIDHL